MNSDWFSSNWVMLSELTDYVHVILLGGYVHVRAVNLASSGARMKTS